MAGLGPAAGPPSAGGRIEIHGITNSFKSKADLDPGEVRSTRFQAWLRVLREQPLTEREQQMLLAFISDGPLPFCSVVLHGDPFGTHQHMSLDHSLWFHRAGDMRSWVLMDSASVATADGRGLNDGWLFTESGNLLVSIRQESLMRKIKS